MVIVVDGGFVHQGEEVEEGEHPMRYLPLGRVYSSSPPCPLPKKPRAAAADAKPPVIVYYRRRRKKPRVEEPPTASPATAPPAPRQLVEDEAEGRASRRKCPLKYELLSLGPAPAALDSDRDGEELVRRRQPRRSGGIESASAGRRQRHGGQKEAPSSAGRRWVELEIEGADPQAFIGLACKVFWPLDDDWYKGSITGYNEVTKKHSVKYDDGEAEDLTLADERIKFSISSEEMKCLNLKFRISNLDKKEYDELLVLPVSFHDYQGLDPGDLVWAKRTGRYAEGKNRHGMDHYASKTKQPSHVPSTYSPPQGADNPLRSPSAIHVADESYMNFPLEEEDEMGSADYSQQQHSSKPPMRSTQKPSQFVTTPEMHESKRAKRKKSSEFQERYLQLKKEEIDRFAAIEEKKLEDPYSISKCVRTLEGLDGLQMSDMVMAADIFKSKENRELFLSFSSDELRLGWIKKQIRQIQTNY